MTITCRTTDGEIDWEAIRRRMGQTGTAADQLERLSPEQARAIMDERARALARVPETVLSAAEVLRVATFDLAGEHYAIETRCIQQVLRLTEYTMVPGGPDFLIGVINLRGEILAVIDLRKFFGISQRGLTDLSRILVLGDERPEFGMLADAVHEVTTLRTDQVLEPPESVAGIGREYLRGVTAEALILLDGDRLLQDSRLIINEDEDRST